MQFYSALATYKILRQCLKNLENSADPDDPAVMLSKHAVLMRIADLEGQEHKSVLDASRLDDGHEVAEI